MKSKREQMIDVIRESYGLDSPRVLAAMLQVPRHKFVSKDKRDLAYKDSPVPIGYGQTMSQPYTVAVMTDLLVSAKDKEQRARVVEDWKVLEIGTGSGYQAAVLSKLFRQVYTIEIVPELAVRAGSVLACLGYKNVHVKKGSGEWGWKEHAPFDAIMITAGVEKVPDELFKQLKAAGVLVAPVGKGNDKVMTRYVKLKNPSASLRTSKKILRLRSGQAKKLSNELTKQPNNQVTNKLKAEEFGIFHFVPFVEGGN